MKKTMKFVCFAAAVVVMIAMLTVAFVACGKDGQSIGHKHSYTHFAANSPTCTQAGNIEYYTCDCGKFFDADKNEIYEEDTIVAATGHDKVTTSWQTDGSNHWRACNNCDEKLDMQAHTEGSDWKEDSPATCKAQAHCHKECSVCGYHMAEEDYGELGQHSWNAQNKCDICGIEKPYIEQDGKIYFGEYPQTKVEDNGIINVLNGMAGSNPVKGNAGDWTDYGYYINKNVDEFMWYIDLEYQDNRYRGVYMTEYRPYRTTRDNNSTTMYQEQASYELNTLYWFLWEPIEWRTLERADGEALLMSNVILDAHHYYNNTDERDIGGKVYPNNYKESDIRAWLLDTFYEWAFDELDQSIIKTTTVDNGASTTTTTDNTYVCENTQDKVFLLSYKDIVNPDYGFNADDMEYDSARQLRPTDYCKAQGIMLTFRRSGWWLRTPYDQNGNNALSIHPTGSKEYNDVSCVYTGGVVPALRMTLI